MNIYEEMRAKILSEQRGISLDEARLRFDLSDTTVNSLLKIRPPDVLTTKEIRRLEFFRHRLRGKGLR